MLKRGEDVEQDIEAAVKLFLLAATSGNNAKGNRWGKIAYAQAWEEGFVGRDQTATSGSSKDFLKEHIMAYAWYSLVPHPRSGKNPHREEKLDELEEWLTEFEPSMVQAGIEMSFEIAKKYPKAAPWKLKQLENLPNKRPNKASATNAKPTIYTNQALGTNANPNNIESKPKAKPFGAAWLGLILSAIFFLVCLVARYVIRQ